MASQVDRVLLTEDDIRRVLTRISHEILEQNRGAYDLVLVDTDRESAPSGEWVVL